MQSSHTIEKLTHEVEEASTIFEMNNTEIKRKYLVWNIECFNIIASRVSVSKGSFGTGYPFYALDSDLNGKLPILQEQIRYNRELVKDGEPFQKSIWLCESCLKNNYSNMPDLKKICKPCHNMIDGLKPRRIINRLPDVDMWIVCEDGKVTQAENELIELFEKYNMKTSDLNPIASIEDVIKISKTLKAGKMPNIFLPIDAHIVEYSTLKTLIEQVSMVLEESKQTHKIPYLPIHPKSYRKTWQYDDEAYNFIWDFIASFKAFNFDEELLGVLENNRAEIASKYTPEELFDFIMSVANDSTYRRFQTPELEESFYRRIKTWLSGNKEIIINKDDGGWR